MAAPVRVTFAHPAYHFAACFEARATIYPTSQAWTVDEALARLPETEVLVVSGLWDNAWLAGAAKLKYVHVCAAGYDRFDLAAFKAKGVRLCNSSGVNVNAVSDHAMALLLTLTRQVHLARDRQARAEWRDMIGDIARREDELAGKTMLIYGLGAIGSRLGRLANAFGMTVLGVRRSVGPPPDGISAVYPPARFVELVPDADVIVLCCPLTAETRGLVDAEVLQRMKPSAYLINVSRGPVVMEDALADALQRRVIAGAGLDVFDPEPLPESSRLWALENAVITPHTGGETRGYEENVIDFLLENLDRLAADRTDLVNQIV